MNLVDNQKIVLYIISSFLIVAAIFLVSFSTYFLVKKLIFSKYEKDIELIINKIKKFNIDKKSTLIRFNTLSNFKQEKYLAITNKLKIIDNDIKNINKNVSPQYQQLLSSIKNKNLKESIILYRSIKKYNKDLLAKINEFILLSKETNNYWNIIDYYMIENDKIIKQLQSYLNINKNKLVNSYDYLKTELDNIAISNYELEDKKIKDNIEIVTLESENYQKRILSLAKKIDAVVNLEWSLYFDIPKKIEKFSKLEEEIRTKLKKELNNIQFNFLKRPFQESIEKTRKLYSKYYFYFLVFSLKEKFNFYINSNIKTINFEINNIINELNNLTILFLENEKYESLNNEFFSLISQFNIENKNILDLEKLSYSDYEFFIEKILNIIYEMNNLISEFNNNNSIISYNKYYLKNLDFWYNKILENKDILESTSENEERVLKLVSSYSSIINLPDEELLNYSKIKEFQKDIFFMYKELFTKLIYKDMTKKLINYISKRNKKDTNEIDDIIIITSKTLLEKRYKDAFEIISNYLIRKRL
ncbi:Uncharacterised protein [Mycoplasmopsis maculosa]|uniref:Uncharacterized protein n=1 Tax=Mycoplasmopsis maculosa TaxID=114885 RepID=A0A449B5B6_9BACT|nr:hypothetical protein [Mycoplasmopsis maculosa]VEU75797.1 Uncharacterised protein [Mycoplasmopsis maculosa]